MLLLLKELLLSFGIYTELDSFFLVFSPNYVRK